MHPLLTVIEVGEHAVPLGSYGALLCVAIAVAATAALRAAHGLQLELGAAITASGVTTASAFAGGLLLHALVQWARLHSLGAALAQPGLTIIGAVPAGALGLALSARRLRLPALRWTERTLPGLLLALALGRVGCLLGGCCFGTPSALPWSVRYTHPLAPAAVLDVARHPVPLYEALVALALVAALVTIRRGTPTQRVGTCLLGYAVARSLLELLRADEVRGVWPLGLATAQLACGAALAVTACLALTWRTRPSRDGV